MLTLDRFNLENYYEVISLMSDDDLAKEIWLLEEHIKVICNSQDKDTIHSLMGALSVAKEESNRRTLGEEHIV